MEPSGHVQNADFTHFDDDGRPRMVDVSEKADTQRIAVATAQVRMLSETRQRIEDRGFAKGDVLATAELSGIMAAKRTSELIPLCHPVMLTKVNVRCEFVSDTVLVIEATVGTTYKTGVEMEALTACSVAALTVYDMCKAVDRSMVIESVQLEYKSGGKSGTFDRGESTTQA